MLDCLIVGAGPAGAIAALVLARAGARVSLVDRAAFPRDKLCGDTVNPGTLALRRRELDALLVGHAVAAGCEFEPHVAVSGAAIDYTGKNPKVTGVRIGPE